MFSPMKRSLWKLGVIFSYWKSAHCVNRVFRIIDYYKIIFFFSFLRWNRFFFIFISGTTIAPTKFSNRMIIFLMFVFSLFVYQFYSSSIVSSLLRPTVMYIDSVQKLEESQLNIGIEDFIAITRAADVCLLLTLL